MTETSAVSRRSLPFILLRATWSAFWASVGAYGLSLTGFLLLRWAEGEAGNSIALVANFLHLMLLPTLILLPLALLARRPLVLVLLALPFGLAVSDVLPAFTNAPRELPSDGQVVTVLTYNLLVSQGGAAVFAERIALVREADADIVALQEVSYSAAAALAEALSADYPYQALYPQAAGVQGQGVLSRYPITDSSFFQSPLPVQLGHMRAVLDVDGRMVVVYNVHPVHPLMSPGLDVGLRGADVAAVLARAAEETSPTLLVGDFNLTPKTADYAALRSAGYTDAFAEVGRGLGYTYPALHNNAQMLNRLIPPLARLDYIFHEDTWLALDARTWARSGGADHRPVVVRLALLQDHTTID